MARPRDPDADGREPVPFAVAGMTPAEALWALMERSLLTMAELRMLTGAAAGSRPVLSLLGITRRQAEMALERWRGPVPGVRLRELPHWDTAAVHGGVPLDAGSLAARARLSVADGNPWGGSP
jgi:hypothetical protein